MGYDFDYGGYISKTNILLSRLIRKDIHFNDRLNNILVYNNKYTIDKNLQEFRLKEFEENEKEGIKRIQDLRHSSSLSHFSLDQKIKEKFISTQTDKKSEVKHMKSIFKSKKRKVNNGLINAIVNQDENYVDAI